jgi:hypothetical protein
MAVFITGVLNHIAMIIFTAVALLVAKFSYWILAEGDKFKDIIQDMQLQRKSEKSRS